MLIFGACFLLETYRLADLRSKEIQDEKSYKKKIKIQLNFKQRKKLTEYTARNDIIISSADKTRIFILDVKHYVKEARCY